MYFKKTEIRIFEYFQLFLKSYGLKKINNNSIFIQFISKKYTIKNSIGNFKKHIDKDDLKLFLFHF